MNRHKLETLSTVKRGYFYMNRVEARAAELRPKAADGADGEKGCMMVVTKQQRFSFKSTNHPHNHAVHLQKKRKRMLNDSYSINNAMTNTAWVNNTDHIVEIKKERKSKWFESLQTQRA